MRLIETSKFTKQRKKIKETHEKNALRKSIFSIMKNPESGKKLKGEFKELRSFSYTTKGQSRRLIYQMREDVLVLISFGPREGSYK